MLRRGHLPLPKASLTQHAAVAYSDCDPSGKILKCLYILIHYSTYISKDLQLQGPAISKPGRAWRRSGFCESLGYAAQVGCDQRDVVRIYECQTTLAHTWHTPAALRELLFRQGDSGAPAQVSSDV